MSDRTDPTERILELLRLTQQEELDCDAFRALLPALLDGNITDAHRTALIAHHQLICPECDEELQILRRALGR
ncbi:MAG: hypothetical protein ACI8S6_002260 [Myxococcota bacterium]|jgi:hypothetical protein